MNRRIIIVLAIACCVLSAKNIFAADKSSSKRAKRSKNKVVLQQKAMAESKQPDSDDQTANEGSSEEFDLQRKQKEVRSLIDRGVEFCAQNNLVSVCHAFTHTKEFIEGEL